MTNLKTLHDQAVALERERGITDTPRLSTPILKERIRAEEELRLEYYSHAMRQWRPYGGGWAEFLRIAEKPEAQPAPEWKAGDVLRCSLNSDLLVSYVGTSESPNCFTGIVVNGAKDGDPVGSRWNSYVPEYFTHYTPTPEERIRFDRIVANAELKAEWEKERFPVQFKGPLELRWHDIHFPLGAPPNWSMHFEDGDELRRKPEPRFVPWSSEDCPWPLSVRYSTSKSGEARAALAKTDSGVTLMLGAHSETPCLVSWKTLFECWLQLDGSKCGKLEEAK